MKCKDCKHYAGEVTVPVVDGGHVPKVFPFGRCNHHEAWTGPTFSFPCFVAKKPKCMLCGQAISGPKGEDQ